MSNKMICPFCFEEIKAKNIEFRCANPTKQIDGSFVCGLEPDEKLAIYRGMTTKIPMHKTFTGKSFLGMSMPREAQCPGCGMNSRDRICSHCHNMLPHYYGETENLMFAVIGAKETGKSHYIAVLIEYMINVLTGSFPFSAQAANDETSQRYKNDFKKYVYDQHVIIQATQSANINRSVREPLIYELKFHDEKNRLKKTVTIAFFDTAGEDLDAEDTMSVVNKYIFNASGIILLLDPLQLTGVRSAVGTNVHLPAVNTEIETIVARTSRLIKKANNLKPNEKIGIPLAVAFTKLDAILPILPASSILRNTGSHYNLGMFDVTDAANVNDEMEALINQWAGHGFLSQVETNFNTYSYFGLSALGCNPQGTKQIDKVIPLRLEDPFLWLLWKHKLIKGTQ